MKRLLSVVAILILAASLLPVKADALLRGAFAPISNGDNLVRGKFSPTLRGQPTSGAGTAASPIRERWIGFVTLSFIVGSESTGEIWLYRNVDQAFAVNELDPVPLRRDGTAAVSYVDPAWSKDGKWLAYVQTNNAVTQSSIYVQQFDNSPLTDGGVALGSPILVADGTGGVHHRHPAFNWNATQIAYDSDAFGPSIDLWTVDISLDAVAHTGTVGTPVRHHLGLDDLSLNSKAEFKPAYNPDGTKIAYVTNRFGVFQIQILTPTADGLGETSVASENNPALVTHDNPSWAPDGHTLYYDAPSNEDPANPQDIYKLDLNTGSKCNIFVDLAGDVDPDVSQFTNTTPDGSTFNFFTFISQAGGFGLQIWLGESIQRCKPALPMNVTISPSQIDISRGTGSPGDSLAHLSDEIVATISFPAVTRTAGYVCRAANVGGDAIRFRRSIIASPTLMGVRHKSAFSIGPLSSDCHDWMDLVAFLGLGPHDKETCFDAIYYVVGDIGKFQVFDDPLGGTNTSAGVHYSLMDVSRRIVGLGLVDKYVGLEVRAYSNRIGQQFIGTGFVKISNKNLAGSSIVLSKNYPNPFNPKTNFSFAIDKPGNVSVRVFNTRGELVRTITNQWYPQGEHEVSWDGKTVSGGHAASGIYYIQGVSGGAKSVIKTVLAK